MRELCEMRQESISFFCATRVISSTIFTSGSVGLGHRRVRVACGARIAVSGRLSQNCQIKLGSSNGAFFYIKYDWGVLGHCQ